MKFKKIKKGISLIMSTVFSLQVFAINKPCLAKDTNRKNTVSVLYTTDDGYFAPTIVSMESALQSMNNDTFYDFHLMVNGGFSKTNDLKRFEKENKDRCSIKTHNMGDEFVGRCGGANNWPPSMYYRLKAASVLNGIDKCIYIDGDTLVVKDLSELFNINLGNNYLGGVLDASTTRFFNNGTRCENYINSGVALINLKKIRDDHKEQELIEEVGKNNKDYIYPDQDIWNIVFQSKIKLLPIKYNFMSNLFMYETFGKSDGFYKITSDSSGDFVQIEKQKIIRTELKNTKSCFSSLSIKDISQNYPTIVHFVCNKPWKSGCGVNNKGKNREVWEPLYQKWRETADSVKQKYGIFIEYKSGLFSNPYVKWGTIVGGSTLLTTAIVGTGIAIKKFYDKKIAKKSNPKF